MRGRAGAGIDVDEGEVVGVGVEEGEGVGVVGAMATTVAGTGDPARAISIV